MGVNRLFTNWFGGGNPPLYCPPLEAPSRIQYLADNDWEVELVLELPNPHSYYDPTLSVLEDAGIPFWIDLEADMNDFYPNFGAEPADYYLDTYSESMDIYKSDYGASPLFKGWTWEQGTVQGMDWVYDNYVNARQRISYFVNQYSVNGINWDFKYADGEWYSESLSAVSYCPLQWVIDRVDEFVFEFYNKYSAPSVINIATMLRDEADRKIGFIVLESTSLDMWATYDQEEQRRGTAMYGNIVKAGVGHLDVAMANGCPGGVDDVWTETLEDRLLRWDALNFANPGTKYTQHTSSAGMSPYYIGASPYCSHDPPPDSFDNTGNELILLKDVGAASTHDITVTSTDTRTHEDYTLALSPDRGTIIGPYPLDDYGGLPTITYDNTNLYVSILKVVPYSEQ